MNLSLRATAAIVAGLLLTFQFWCEPGNAQQRPRAMLWVDAVEGEPVAFQDMLEDLSQSRVIYLGEIHSIPRHHELEREVLEGLEKRGLRLVLAMEQFEFSAQLVLDRFNSGGMDVSRLVKEAELEKRWPGYSNYVGLITAARAHEIPVLALNARAETIRAIGRRGLERLTTDQRQQLPQQIVTKDPVYERWLNKVLGVHMAFDTSRLRPAFEAQVARDETMADRLANYLNSPAGQKRTAVVVCGRGHCEYGLGTPARVYRRIPGIRQRIVLFSESGDLELTEQERKQARSIEVSHEFLRELERPAGDYFQVTQTRGDAD
jgi:uncharacterized iron-regulated protein